jgi:folate-binding protein YgfZ
MSDFQKEYAAARAGGIGFYERERGLIEVSGKEAVQFLNGLITADVAKLEPYAWTAAAFPNAQGRLLAVVRVLRTDDKFLFETEAATHEKVFQNLFRFTFAGDFKVADLSGEFSCLFVRGPGVADLKYKIPSENEVVAVKSGDRSGFIVRAYRSPGFDAFWPKTERDEFVDELKTAGAIELSERASEVLRVENGEPLYGVDMDETTIVPELDLPDLISYNKGCYIGQEIIARIYFRGHVAKKMTGLIFEDERVSAGAGDEIKSSDGKNAGRLTSVAVSPQLGKTIALAFVRYDYLAEGTELKVNDSAAKVKNLPFVE